MPATARTPRLSRQQLSNLALDLRRELARLERAFGPAHASDERDAVMEALQRIDDGSYGICLRCTRSIAHERLDVMPATRFCVACAGAQQGQYR